MCNVVAREKVAVLTRGTLMDAEMVAAKADASYVMAGVLCWSDFEQKAHGTV